jgi:hypothetical protein
MKSTPIAKAVLFIYALLAPVLHFAVRYIYRSIVLSTVLFIKPSTIYYVVDHQLYTSLS